MGNYQKIATIVIRAFAYYLLLWAILEWIIIGAGTLLITFGIFSRNSIAFEVRLLSSLVYLVVGLILLARSQSLGIRIAYEMDDEDSYRSDQPTTEE